VGSGFDGSGSAGRSSRLGREQGKKPGGQDGQAIGEDHEEQSGEPGRRVFLFKRLTGSAFPTGGRRPDGAVVKLIRVTTSGRQHCPLPSVVPSV